MAEGDMDLVLRLAREMREILKDDLELTPTQAGEILGVGPRTVNNAADMGLIACHRTAGGHRRYWQSVVQRHKVLGTFDDAAAVAAKRKGSGGDSGA